MCSAASAATGRTARPTRRHLAARQRCRRLLTRRRAIGARRPRKLRRFSACRERVSGAAARRQAWRAAIPADLGLGCQPGPVRPPRITAGRRGPAWRGRCRAAAGEDFRRGVAAFQAMPRIRISPAGGRAAAAPGVPRQHGPQGPWREPAVRIAPRSPGRGWGRPSWRGREGLAAASGFVPAWGQPAEAEQERDGRGCRGKAGKGLPSMPSGCAGGAQPRRRSQRFWGVPAGGRRSLASSVGAAGRSAWAWRLAASVAARFSFSVSHFSMLMPALAAAWPRSALRVRICRSLSPVIHWAAAGMARGALRQGLASSFGFLRAAMEAKVKAGIWFRWRSGCRTGGRRRRCGARATRIRSIFACCAGGGCRYSPRCGIPKGGRPGCAAPGPGGRGGGRDAMWSAGERYPICGW